MKSQRRLITVGTLILLLSVVVQVAFALPPLPSSFYGTVKVDGVNVPAGTLVAAWIGGMKYAETIVSTFSGDTVYSLNVPGDDPATPGIIEGGNPGDTILFTIGSNPADQTGTWQSGANVQLNLSRAGAPVPASITVEVVPPVLIVNSGAAAVVTATVRDGSSQPIAGAILNGSTFPSALGNVSLPNATNASGQSFGTWTAGSIAGNGLLRASSGGVTGTTPITLNNPLPTLTSLSPMTVTMGSSSFTLTVSGTNFVNSSLIRWGGAPRTTVYISATQLRTTIDGTELVMTGTVDVTVFNPAPGGGVSNVLPVAIVQSQKHVYLPVIVRNYPAIPAPPLARVMNWLQRAALEYLFRF